MSFDWSTTITSRALGLGDHLLPPQRAPSALDEVEVVVDLVGAVDREIDVGVVGECGHGNPGRRASASLATEVGIPRTWAS